MSAPICSVSLAPGADDNGFALMLSQLIRQNVDERPEKAVALSKMWGRVAIQVMDLGMSVTLRFADGRLTVYDGVAGIPDITVRADAEWVTKMSLVEIHPRFGLPDPRGEVFQEIQRAEKAGEIETIGALSSPLLLLRLNQVMSVAQA